MKNSYILEVENGVQLRVRAIPNAKIEKIDAIETRDDGLEYLKIKIHAQAEDGKANKAIINLLAKSLGLAKSKFSLINGDKSRTKNLLVFCDRLFIESKISDILKG